MHLQTFLIGIFLTFFISQPVSCNSNSCIRFKDPPGQMSGQRDTTSSFAFTISVNCRRRINMLTIFYSSSDKTDVYCNFIHFDSPCLDPDLEEYCFCTDTGNEYLYVIKKHAPERTGIRWIITGKSSTKPEFEEQLYVASKDHLAPTITDLRVIDNNGIIVNSKHIEATVTSTITIHCSWEPGYPPTTTWLSRDGVGLLSTGPSTYVLREGSRLSMELVMSNLQCSDSGLIACEADGARRNLSFRLDVQCNDASTAKSSAVYISPTTLGDDPLSSENAVSSSFQTNRGDPTQVYATTPSAVDKASEDVSHTRVVLYSSIGGGGFVVLIIITFVIGIFFRRKAKRKSLESAQEAEAEALRMRPLPPTPPESRRESISMLSTSSDVYQEVKDSHDTGASPNDPDDYLHPVASEVKRGKCRTIKMGVESRNRDLTPIRPVRKLRPIKPKFHRFCIPPASLPPDTARLLDLGFAQRRKAVSHIEPCEGLSSEEGAVGGVSLDNVQPLFYASRSCIFPTLSFPGKSDRYHDNRRRAHSKRRPMANKSNFHMQANQALGISRKYRDRNCQKMSMRLKTNRTVPYPQFLKKDELDDNPPLPQRTTPAEQKPTYRVDFSTPPELGLSAHTFQPFSFGFEAEPTSILDGSYSNETDDYTRRRPAAKLTIPRAANVDATRLCQKPKPTKRVRSIQKKYNAASTPPCLGLTMAPSGTGVSTPSQHDAVLTNCDYQNLQPAESRRADPQRSGTLRGDDHGGYMCMDKSRDAAKINIVDRQDKD